MTYDKENDLGRLIYFTARELQTFGENFFKPHGITPEQFHLLENLDPGRGLSQREIGALIRKTPANVTRILDRLEKRNLLIRKASPADRRVVLVFPSPSGESLVNEMFRLFEQPSLRLVEGVDQEASHTARKVLARISENITAMTAELRERKKR